MIGRRRVRALAAAAGLAASAAAGGPPSPDAAIEPWAERFARVLSVAGLSSVAPEGSDDAVQVVFWPTWGDAAVVRLEPPIDAEARLVAYRLETEEGRPVHIAESWSRALNRVEWAAVELEVARAGFWEIPGYSRLPLVCDGRRVAKSIPGQDCIMMVQSDGALWYVEARLGGRRHAADGQSEPGELQWLGARLLGLAGVRPELWGVEDLLGEDLDARQLAGEILEAGGEEEPDG